MARYAERIQAIKLRKQGWSIGGIAEKIGISKGTSSLWCKDIALTNEQVNILAMREKYGAHLGRLRAAENRRRERLEREAYFSKKGKEQVGELSDRDLFVLGIAIYWAEGEKKNRRLDFVNSDPIMIKFWIEWLDKFFGVGKDSLICTVGINQIHLFRLKEVERYWSRVTGIAVGNFNKASIKKVNNKKVYENMNEHYGTLQLRTKKSTNLNYQILGMIAGLHRSFEANRDKM